MEFRISTIPYQDGWVSLAQKGLLTFISDKHNNEDDAREDVKQQIHQHCINVYNSIHN
jgi:hypothetical protein